MALSPAIILNLDGQDPYHLDGTADPSGAFHLPIIKQGSSVAFRLNFPLIGNVNDFYWNAHFRSPLTNALPYYTVRWRVPGQTDSDRSFIEPDPADPTKAISLYIEGDEVAAAGISAGNWDIECYRWVAVNNFNAGFSDKDRPVQGSYLISANVTRETAGLGIPGVGA